MKKVLLTGASGFVGSKCIDFLLQKNFQVFGVSSKKQQADREGFQWVHLDLSNSNQTIEIMNQIKPTHLLHLAWNVEPPHYWQSYENIHWVNISLTLLKAFLDSGGRRIVMTGTCAEYEWNNAICDEINTPCNPSSLYGIAKYSLFLMAKKLAENFKAPFSWARLFHLYGPGDHPKKLVRSILSSLLKNQPIPCSDGEQIRDYLYVEDAADALVAVLESESAGAINIGSGQEYRIKNILNFIGNKLRKNELLQLGALPKNPLEPSSLIPSIQKLQSNTSWRPKTDLSKGLDLTITSLLH